MLCCIVSSLVDLLQIWTYHKYRETHIFLKLRALSSSVAVPVGVHCVYCFGSFVSKAGTRFGLSGDPLKIGSKVRSWVPSVNTRCLTLGCSIASWLAPILQHPCPAATMGFSKLVLLFVSITQLPRDKYAMLYSPLKYL